MDEVHLSADNTAGGILFERGPGQVGPGIVELSLHLLTTVIDATKYVALRSATRVSCQCCLFSFLSEKQACAVRFYLYHVAASNRAAHIPFDTHHFR